MKMKIQSFQRNDMTKYSQHRRARSLSPIKKYNRDVKNYKNAQQKSNSTLRLQGNGLILNDHLCSDITFSNLKDNSIDHTSILPRWPYECQVIFSRMNHIRSNPSEPELFYSCTGKEPTPRPIGEYHGSLIYEYISSNPLNYFSKSISGPSNEAQVFYPSLNVSFESLQFESRFECGNLTKVYQITESYYELYVRPDLYTSKHTQWFYFQIKNMKSDLTYRFSIVNFSKSDSLYNYGMKPVLYSNIEAEKHYIGWTRVGSNIRYYKNKMISTHEEEEEPEYDVSSYTLTFNITFPHNDDIVYLAHCYPYSYTDLQEDLKNITRNGENSLFSDLKILCKSLAGNNIYLLTISSPQTFKTIPELLPKKKIIFISCRVHPGETPSSWILRGILFFLSGSSRHAKLLRDRYIFKIVPMLNPDGVIVGNTRTSLSGRDLNRQYKSVIKEAFPPIFHVKSLIKRYIEDNGVIFYCDLHAHSRKLNVFIYGCESRRHSDKYLKEQIFPLMLHKNSSEKFSFEDCKFKVTKSKESTGRVVFWNMGIANSYTLEASYGGSNLGSRAYTHFNPSDYESIGRSFCKTLLDFHDPCSLQESLRSKIHYRLLKDGSTATEPTNIALTDYSSVSSCSFHSDTSSESEWHDIGRCTKKMNREKNNCDKNKKYNKREKKKERKNENLNTIKFYIRSSMKDTCIRQVDCQIENDKGWTATDESSTIMYKSVYQKDKLHISAQNCRRVQSEIIASINQFKCSWMQKTPSSHLEYINTGDESYGCFTSTTEDEKEDDVICSIKKKDL